MICVVCDCVWSCRPGAEYPYQPANAEVHACDEDNDAAGQGRVGVCVFHESREYSCLPPLNVSAQRVDIL